MLLVEDEDPKRDKIRAFLSELSQGNELDEARSVRSAVAAIRKRRPDLLLLDMSLPTFDITHTEPGGRPQGFGGKEVLKYLDRFHIMCPTIVVTGYEAFVTDDNSTVSLEDMDSELREKFSRNYRGLVYYNSLYADWETELRTKIQGALEK